MSLLGAFVKEQRWLLPGSLWGGVLGALAAHLNAVISSQAAPISAASIDLMDATILGMIGGMIGGVFGSLIIGFIVRQNVVMNIGLSMGVGLVNGFVGGSILGFIIGMVSRTLPQIEMPSYLIAAVLIVAVVPLGAVALFKRRE